MNETLVGRIHLLDELEQLWDAHEDWTFGQLLANVLNFDLAPPYEKELYTLSNETIQLMIDHFPYV